MSNELQADFIKDDKRKCVLIRLTAPLHIGGITVPAGFVSDGCSVPRIGWTIIGHPFHYLYIKEAVGHDYLYKSQIMSKIAADVWFFRQLKKPWLRIRRYVIFGAVFVFGWIPWFKHKYNNYKERQANVQTDFISRRDNVRAHNDRLHGAAFVRDRRGRLRPRHVAGDRASADRYANGSSRRG